MRDALTRIAGGLFLALYLTACGSSPPIHFYRLTATDAAISGSAGPALGIGPVEIPEFLNRGSLVHSGGDNRLEIANNERWAEPLSDGMQRVLGLNLAQLLNTENLMYFPWDPRHAPQYAIRINVLDLDADNGQASMVADWLLYHPGDGETISQRISSFKTPLSQATVSPAELPPAYSALLLQLSETIAAAIREDQQKEPAQTSNE